MTPAGYGLTRDEVYDSASAFRGFLDSDWSGTGFTLDLELGDYRLQTITGADSIDYRRYQDFEGTPLEHLHIDYNTEIDAWSQEVRFFYEGSDTLSWVLGASYAEDELHEDTLLYGAQGVLPRDLRGRRVQPAGLRSGHRSVRALRARRLALRRRVEPRQRAALHGRGQELRRRRAARLRERRDGAVRVHGRLDLVRRMVGQDRARMELDRRPADLRHDLARLQDRRLLRRLPDQRRATRAVRRGDAVGARARREERLADGRVRLNASVFSYDREDVQQNAGDPTSPIQIKRITNIGDVDTVGAEAEVTWLATDGLSLNLGVGATDAEVSDSTFIQAASLPFLPDTPMEGSNLPNYSDLSVNFVGRYEGSFGANLGWFAQLEGRYQSEQDLSIITNPVEVPVFQEPGYSLWNVRFGVSGEAWAAQLYVNNASDETYRVLARNDGAFGIHELYGMPRTAGVELPVSVGVTAHRRRG